MLRRVLEKEIYQEEGFAWRGLFCYNQNIRGRLNLVMLKHENWLIFLLLLFVIVMTYLPALGGTFILDDYVWIRSLSVEQIKNLFVGSWEHGNTLRPIMRLQFFSDRLFFGENPVLWHITNLTLHALVSLSAYRILRNLTGKRGLSLVAAFIFAVFPTNHEVVAWISGRTHSFGLLLSLAAGFLLFQSFKPVKYAAVSIAAGFAFLILAFLTYEVSFVVPIILFTATVVFGPRVCRAFLISGFSTMLLVAMVVYRYYVLGGSIGSVGAHHENIFLAPFLNLRQLLQIYLYSKELKILVAGLLLILILFFFKNRGWLEYRNRLLYVGFFFIYSSVIAYLPFAIVHGVAPRFLYSSILFAIIGIALIFSFLSTKIGDGSRVMIMAIITLIGLFSVYRTWQVAGRYRQVADAYTLIGNQIIADFPEWPRERDALFYGIPNSYENVLAFLTYFDLSIKYRYPGQDTGQIYRAERLLPEELQWVLDANPVIYKFVSFGAGIERIFSQ